MARKPRVRYRSPSRLDRPADWHPIAYEQRRATTRRKARVANALEPFDHLKCTHGCPLHCKRVRVKSCQNCSRYFPLDAPNTRYCEACRHAMHAIQQHGRYHRRLDRTAKYLPFECPQCHALKDRLERLATYGKQATATRQVQEQEALPFGALGPADVDSDGE